METPQPGSPWPDTTDNDNNNKADTLPPHTKHTHSLSI